MPFGSDRTGRSRCASCCATSGQHHPTALPACGARARATIVFRSRAHTCPPTLACTRNHRAGATNTRHHPRARAGAPHLKGGEVTNEEDVVPAGPEDGRPVDVLVVLRCPRVSDACGHTRRNMPMPTGRFYLSPIQHVPPRPRRLIRRDGCQRRCRVLGHAGLHPEGHERVPVVVVLQRRRAVSHECQAGARARARTRTHENAPPGYMIS